MKRLRVNKVDALGLEWLLLIIGPVYSIGMWFGEDQRTNIIKTHV